MADELFKPTVTIKTRVEKFQGEYADDKAPVEILEMEETISLEEFLAGGGSNLITVSEG
jgi:hypothetical protein